MIFSSTRWWNHILMLNGILFNFIVMSFFIVNSGYINATSVGDAKCTNSCRSTKYDRSFYKILNRKKRYLIYPPGSNVVVSISSSLYYELFISYIDTLYL